MIFWEGFMATDERFHQTGSPTTPRFADVATFMRTKRHDIIKDIDIGLAGVPFDLGVNFRTGARQGPAGVREASRLIRRVHPTSGIKPFDICNVADLGDSPINPLDLLHSIELIEEFFGRIHEAGIRPIAIGGDHTIPLPIMRAIAKDRPVGVLHFDAHPDTLDELCGTKINHATFLRRAHEEGLLRPENVIQVGLRGSRFSDHDIQYGIDVGFTVITMDEYEEMGRAKVIETTQSRFWSAGYCTMGTSAFPHNHLPQTTKESTPRHVEDSSMLGRPRAWRDHVQGAQPRMTLAVREAHFAAMSCSCPSTP